MVIHLPAKRTVRQIDQAKSFWVLGTTDPGPEDETVLFELNADNIKLVQEAIDTPPPTVWHGLSASHNVDQKLLQQTLTDKILARRITQAQDRERERRHRKLNVVKASLAQK